MVAHAQTIKINEARGAAQRNAQGSTITISVHGTFAGHSEAKGTRWWQAGSAFASLLRGYLPNGVRMAEQDEVFHWSGENSERARSQAATELLSHLKQQEASGKSYHLVGHSHGGTVIWRALMLATHTKVQLSGLRSWTTVGTPFLRHRSRGAFSPMNLLMIVLMLVLLKPAVTNGVALCQIVQGAATGAKPTLVMPQTERSDYGSVLGSPCLALMRVLGVPMTEAPNGGLQIGTYTPDSELSFAAYLATTREGLTIMSMLMLSCYTFSVLTLEALAPLLESYRIRAELHLDRLAFERFGSRWLGIWSRHDEAIVGLQATLSLSATFIRNMVPRTRVFISDTPSLLKRPIFWLVAPIFNHFVRPAADHQVRQIVTRSAQGNDRPTAELVAVMPSPVDIEGSDFQPLPDELNNRLLECADQAAREFAPKLRQLLCDPLFALGTDALGSELTGKELIHTSYFEHEQIAALIGCNITLEEHSETNTPRCRGLSHVLRAWLANNKREAVCGNVEFPSWLTTSVVRPRRAI